MTAPQRNLRYVEIADELRSRIAAGSLPRGARLPGQRELGREFGVTVMTVRQALALLEREGLVEARHGSGTYVAEPQVAYRLDHLRSLADELAEQGLELETRVLSARLVDDPPAYEIERVRLAAGVPVALQRSLLPPEAAAALAGVDLAVRSLYEALESELGLRAQRAEETLRPVMLAPREAGLLAVEPGTPAIASERLTLDAAGEPLLLDLALLPAGRVVVAVERLAPAAIVGYRLASADQSPRA